ncbi:sigma factor G inhibitor Gin [Terribacillus sp. DMT04]|uniref:sigma factor G inhibitor Gin n=1 Tax=Terribacillus sp. DMT04 TaxID=2850441 RepID=UPI001C2C2613|nr:sigma factor G inhibitor Gin [Terribacillus sp. DMT04]QXE01764.1 sigma factor G inhibitor Gin [Terribacillus sp. DMT04]
MSKSCLCGICDQEKKEGIQLYRLFICRECEQKIVHTEPKDVQYHYFVKKLRNLNQMTFH